MSNLSGRALVGIYPGSFDPVHLGHVDLVRRAVRIADRLIVAVLDNPGKSCLFSVQERLELLRSTLRGIDRVEVDSFEGLLVEHARQRGASLVFRGLRAVSDFEYEFQMALMNRRLEPSLETVFLTPAEDLTFVSSRLVKEVAGLGGPVESFVPVEVARALQSRRKG